MMYRVYNNVMVKLASAALAYAPSSGVCGRHRGAANRRLPHFIGRLVLTALAVSAVSAAAQQSGPLTLDQCVSMALQSNLRLEIAAEKMVEMNAAVDEAAVAGMPKISANASYTWLVPRPSGTQTVAIGASPVPNSYGFLDLINRDIDYKVSGSVINAGITANYVLYSGGRIKNARKIAETSRTASEWQRKSAVREIRRDVTKAYYQALSVNKNIMALDSAIALMETTIKDMKNLVEVGMLGEHEILLMEVEISNLRLSRQQVATGSQAAHDYLATLIGVPVNTPITLVDELHYPESFNIPELTSMQTKAKESSTDLKALDEQLSIIETSIAITDAANMPTIVAAAGYAGSHQGRMIEPQKADWEWDNQGTLSLIAQWDIWDGNAKRHKRSQARSQKRQLELTMNNIKTQLDMGVKSSAASLQDAYDAIAVSRKSIDQAKKSYGISNDLFQEGMLASSELLRSHNSILQSEIAYYNALSTFYGRQADLDYLVNEEK